MKKNGIYEIPFVGLKEGKHQFEYQIKKEFFDSFQFDEFNDVLVKVTLLFTKKARMFELEFSCRGWVGVNCDLTNEPFRQSIDNQLNLVVKFGEDYNDDDDEILIIPHGEYKIEVSQYIYETIVLGVPAKRIHPGVIDGTLQSDILEKLNELERTHKKTNELDARWDKLKKLK